MSRHTKLSSAPRRLMWVFGCLGVMQFLGPALTTLASGIASALLLWASSRQLVDALSALDGVAIVRASVWVVACFLAGQILRVISRHQDVVLRAAVERSLERRLMSGVAHIPMASLLEESTHREIHRTRKSIKKAYLLLRQTIYQAEGLVEIAVASFLLGRADWRLPPVALVCALISARITLAQGLQSYYMDYSQTAVEKEADYHERLLTTKQYVMESQVYGLAPMLIARWEDLLAVSFGKRRTLLARHSAAQAVEAIAGVFLAAPIILSLKYPMRSLSPGDVVFAITAMFGIYHQSVNLGIVGSEYIRSVKSLLDVEEFLNRPPTPSGSANPQDVAPSLVQAPIGSSVSIRGLYFRYPGQPSDALVDVFLDIHEGETVALVGPNGAGKSTLVRLILGLYAPGRGQVLVRHGSNYLDPTTVEKPFASAVFQEFGRYQETVERNIWYGNRQASEDDVLSALAQARLPEVFELPDGAKTWLGRGIKANGVDLSGGQWQKIALARAYVSRFGALRVYDEPTASLDPSAELEMMSQFIESGRDTRILCCHRLGITKKVDRIVVLDKGKIVEDGHFRLLIDSGGVFARMFRAQADLYA